MDEAKNEELKTKHPVKTVYDRVVLVGILSREFPNAAINASHDLRYARLAHNDVVAFAGEYRNELLRYRRTLKWAVAYDCDKFSDFARSLLKMKHGDTQGFNTDTPEGVTAAMLCYNVNGTRGRGHAINVFVTERGVETWEPQTQQFVTLTDAEKQSAWEISF